MGEYIGAVTHLYRNAKVRLVGPVFHHGLAVRDADKREAIDFLCGEFGENAVNDLFNDREDFILCDKRHFDIELIKFTG